MLIRRSGRASSASPVPLRPTVTRPLLSVLQLPSAPTMLVSAVLAQVTDPDCVFTAGAQIQSTPGTLVISSGPIHADNFTAAGINEDSGADTIDVLAHAGLNQGASGTIILNSVGNLSPANAGT